MTLLDVIVTPCGFEFINISVTYFLLFTFVYSHCLLLHFVGLSPNSTKHLVIACGVYTGVPGVSGVFSLMSYNAGMLQQVGLQSMQTFLHTDNGFSMVH